MPKSDTGALDSHPPSLALDSGIHAGMTAFFALAEASL